MLSMALAAQVQGQDLFAFPEMDQTGDVSMVGAASKWNARLEGSWIDQGELQWGSPPTWNDHSLPGRVTVSRGDDGELQAFYRKCESIYWGACMMTFGKRNDRVFLIWSERFNKLQMVIPDDRGEYEPIRFYVKDPHDQTVLANADVDMESDYDDMVNFAEVKWGLNNKLRGLWSPKGQLTWGTKGKAPHWRSLKGVKKIWKKKNG